MTIGQGGNDLHMWKSSEREHPHQLSQFTAARVGGGAQCSNSKVSLILVVDPPPLPLASDLLTFLGA